MEMNYADDFTGDTAQTESELDKKLAEFDRKSAEHLERLRAFQEFWRDALAHNIDVPYYYYETTSHYCDVAQYDYEDRSEDGSAVLDVEATRVQFARIMKWARKNGWTVKKNEQDKDSDEYIQEIRDIPGPVEYMKFTSTRQVTCKKVQTGTKHVPAEITEAHEEPVYEYVCEKVAFLAIETD